MYNTAQVSARSGYAWFNILKYAKRGILPTAKLIMGQRKIKGRWQYTEEDIRFLSALKFYRSLGFEFEIAVDKADESIQKEDKRLS